MYNILILELAASKEYDWRQTRCKTVIFEYWLLEMNKMP